MKNIRAASVQFEHAPGDKQANFAKIRRFVGEASEQGVEMIIFPECCITGYFYLRNLSKDELTTLAEPVFDGPSSQELIALAAQYGMTVGAGLVESGSDGKLYNTYVVAMPDGTVTRHRKLHCFISEYMDSGSEYTVFDTPHGCRAGILICYDNNLGENVRINELAGAEILIAPHQTGGCKTPSPFCMGVVDRKLWDERARNPGAIEAEFKGEKGREWLLRWLPARAHDNGLFLIFSNGVGVDDNEIRTGNSMILDPYGRIINETWEAGDRMVIGDLDASLQKKSTGRRWLRTRRPELYTPLTKPTGIEQDTRTVRFED
ncbi:nitrilase family protein [Candidatus Latescibacterota bacterium]